MNFRKFSLFIALFLSGFNTVFGNGPKNVQEFINHSDWNFVENKGQLSSSEIKYYARPNGASGRGHQGGVCLYCKPGMIEFVFTKIESENTDQISESTSLPSGFPLPKGAGGLISERETEREKQITTCRVDLTLLNSNPSAQIIASDQQEYYENYYTENTGENGITNVHTYKTITYKSIYPDIDLILHSREEGMKYEFVVYPGGKVSDIQIQWNGLENIKKNKDLGIEYSCSLGEMKESNPFSYQDSKEISSAFILKNNRVSFQTGKYDKTKTLVIDPTLEWGTYFGGSSYDQGNGVVTDNAGNVFMTGSTNSYNNIATSGAYHTSFALSFLAKFSSSGVLLWGTYFGDDYYGRSVNGISIDVAGSVYITGQTRSPSSVATSGAYQTSYAGGYGDAYLTKFSGSGNLIWSTYFGGTGQEFGGGVATDNLGNVYITGSTNSYSGIATSGAYHTSLEGSEGAFLAKFDTSGKLYWSTYFGGTLGNGEAAISTDGSGNVYISGCTADTLGIATAGAYQTSYAGGSEDGFLAKFRRSGSLEWATYYGGSGDEIWIQVSSDALGYVYITGATNSSSGIASVGAYQSSCAGNSDAFLAKFDSSGTRIWSTYYGGKGFDEAVSITNDTIGNVYLAGVTESSNGIATSGVYQTSFGGVEDAFLAKFTSSGDLNWATYYGGPLDDVSYVLAVDKIGNAYITGFTTSLNGIATSGAYQTNYGGGTDDAFLAKFTPSAKNDAGISAILNLNGTICPGLHNTSFQLHDYGFNELDSIIIGWSINGTPQSQIHWKGKLLSDSSLNLSNIKFYFTSGLDTIRAWTSMPNGFIDTNSGNDSSSIIINISSLPTAIAGPDTILCYNETYTMQGAGGITYLWTPAKYLSNDTIASPKAVLPNSQLYTLYVRNKYGCEDSANVLLTVKPPLQVKINPVVSPVCYGSSVSLSAVGSGGDSAHYSFLWPHDSLQGNPVNLKLYKSGWHSVVLRDNCSGSPGIDSVFMEVTPSPKADFTILNRHPYLPDTSFRFQNLSTNATTYLWTFGDSSPSNNAVDPVHIYTDSGTYKITLIAYGKCANDTGYGYIHIFSKYINIYIPDAFSPNGDGINDVFDIKGLGFVDYNITIYNRWGELAFETTDTKKSWDGSFKNQPAQEGIYMYMISVTDQFGIKHYFSGNLTLMR